MAGLIEDWINCPYCAESIQVLLDPTEAGQTYTEDCKVCCAPILFELQGSDEDIFVTVRREDD